MIKAVGRHRWYGPVIQKAMHKAETKAVNASLNKAILIAKRRAPYQTGRLVRSMRLLVMARRRRGRVVGRMGSLLPYANKINLQQREGTGSGYMDDARASFVSIRKLLRKEWVKQVAQDYRISRR